MDEQWISVLSDVITIEESIQSGTTENLQELCERLNSMVLTDDQKEAVEDALKLSDEKIARGGNVILFLLNNLDCIEFKKEQILELDASMVWRRRDSKEMDSWVKENIKEGMFDGDYDFSRLASSLTFMCLLTNNSEKLAVLRTQLEVFVDGL